MGTAKSHTYKNGPSTFALLVDDINQMSESEQKTLWLQINKQKLSVLAKEIDTSASSNNIATHEIDLLIKEARSGNRKKKG